IGFTVQAADLESSSGVQDQWIVLGRAIEHEDRVKVQRTWLCSVESAREALVLDFAVGNTALDASLAPGLVFKGEAVFFPGVAPARAILRERRTSNTSWSAEIPAGGSIHRECQRFRETLARRPWIERFPMRLRDVAPLREGEHWLLRDWEGAEISLSA